MLRNVAVRIAEGTIDSARIGPLGVSGATRTGGDRSNAITGSVDLELRDPSATDPTRIAVDTLSREIAAGDLADRGVSW